MEIIVVAPLASTALDMALDASGGGLPILACGSGRKLKTALALAVSTPSAPGLHHPKFVKACQPLGICKFPIGGRGSQNPLQMQHRYSSSLVPVRETVTTKSSDAFQVSAIPNPRSAAACRAGSASWVCDPDAFLSSLEQTQLHDLLDRINTKASVQCALVVLTDVPNGGKHLSRFRSFGTSLFNSWGVGSAEHNNGVLVLLFQEARRLEIVTGNGMSAALPDRWLSDMQLRLMVPHLKAGNHAAALTAGIEAIEQQLHSKAPPEWRRNSSPAASALIPSFGGGQGVLALNGQSRRDEVNSDIYILPSLLGLVGLAVLGGITDDKQTLRQLEAQLADLQKEHVFRDSTGAHLAWPYQAAPETMGLLDVTSQPQTSNHPKHPFLLASQGELTIHADAHGFGNRSLEVHLCNCSSESVTVSLPAGSMFVATQQGRSQPLVTMKAACEEVGPGEERVLLLDSFCGDSGGRAPRGNMIMSPFVLDQKYLGSQRALWQWSAPFQQRGQTSFPAAQDFQTLQDSFDMSQTEAETLLAETQVVVEERHSARQQHLSALRSSVHEEQVRLTRLAESRSSSSGGSSSGFSGGRSSGGGAGCSY